MGTKHINAAGSSFCLISPRGLHMFCTIGLTVGLLAIGACHDSGSKVSEAPEVAEVTAVKSVAAAAEAVPSEPTAPAEPQVADSSLFDGKTLGHWQITDFGGQGDVYVKDGSIYLDMGNDMSAGSPFPSARTSARSYSAAGVVPSAGCPTSTITTPRTTRLPGLSRSRTARKGKSPSSTWT